MLKQAPAASKDKMLSESKSARDVTPPTAGRLLLAGSQGGRANYILADARVERVINFDDYDTND